MISKEKLVRAVMVSCNCDENEALECINGEVDNLKELLEADDFRVTDIPDACTNLGLEPDYCDVIARLVYV